MNIDSSRAAKAAVRSQAPTDQIGRAAKLLRAGQEPLTFLECGQPIGAADLRTTLTDIFGGSDAEGSDVAGRG